LVQLFEPTPANTVSQSEAGAFLKESTEGLGKVHNSPDVTKLSFADCVALVQNSRNERHEGNRSRVQQIAIVHYQKQPLRVRQMLVILGRADLPIRLANNSCGFPAGRAIHVEPPDESFGDRLPSFHTPGLVLGDSILAPGLPAS
jgi:hypothetical protein